MTDYDLETEKATLLGGGGGSLTLRSGKLRLLLLLHVVDVVVSLCVMKALFNIVNI